jgi:hypothetical protein
MRGGNNACFWSLPFAIMAGSAKLHKSQNINTRTTSRKIRNSGRIPAAPGVRSRLGSPYARANLQLRLKNATFVEAKSSNTCNNCSTAQDFLRNGHENKSNFNTILSKEQNYLPRDE